MVSGVEGMSRLFHVFGSLMMVHVGVGFGPHRGASSSWSFIIVAFAQVNGRSGGSMVSETRHQWSKDA
jgi:hypothetical protein